MCVSVLLALTLENSNPEPQIYDQNALRWAHRNQGVSFLFIYFFLLEAMHKKLFSSCIVTECLHTFSVLVVKDQKLYILYESQILGIKS